MVTIWKCNVCGKQNVEEGRIQKCVTCGRQKGHVGPKNISVLSTQCKSFGHVARRDEIAKAKRVRWGGFEGKPSLFLFHGTDYEVIDRTAIKDDVISVLSSIRSTYET